MHERIDHAAHRVLRASSSSFLPAGLHVDRCLFYRKFSVGDSVPGDARWNGRAEHRAPSISTTQPTGGLGFLLHHRAQRPACVLPSPGYASMASLCDGALSVLRFTSRIGGPGQLNKRGTTTRARRSAQLPHTAHGLGIIIALTVVV